MQRLILAFDIEKSGASVFDDIIGLGAVVMNEQYEIVDSLLIKGYYPDHTKFEERCWNEFWSKNIDQLKVIECDPLVDDYNRREINMVTQFRQFRIKWENYCTDNNFKLELVSDNKVFDGGHFNYLISKLSEDLPMPFSAGSQRYSSFWETHSELRGFLMAVCPEFDSDWGFINKLAELYHLPPKKVDHDHNPVNDAYNIAYEHMVLLNIKNGRVSRR